jgi:hypothetical protein
MKRNNITKALIGIFILIFLFIAVFAILVLKKYNNSSGDYVLKIEEESKVVEPAEEDEIIDILNIVSNKLRVFDLETLHPELKSIIGENINNYNTNEEKKKFIETTISEYFIKWKDEIIRDTLIEERGEYASEDYEYIDERTGIATIVKFAVSFEMEIFDVD